MTIDIDRLTEAELRDLNRRIVARLRFLHQSKAHASMLAFSIGDRVCFCPPDRGPVTGVLARYNKKTVTVIADDGGRWNVSPQLLAREAKAPSGDECGQVSGGKPR
jgi:hypothetical protein